jgi:hypothetical protein
MALSRGSTLISSRLLLLHACTAEVILVLRAHKCTCASATELPVSVCWHSDQKKALATACL